MSDHVHTGEIICVLRYQLTYQQTFEALALILDKRGKKARALMALVLLAVAGGFFVFHAGDAVYGTLGVLCALCAALVYCYPGVKARRSAKKISRRGGWYALTFYADGTVGLPDGQRLSLQGDRGSRGFAAARVVALRPDREHTLCIPVEAIDPARREALYAMLERSMRSFQRT